MSTPSNFDPTWTEPADYIRDAEWRELLEAAADWQLDGTLEGYDREVENTENDENDEEKAA